MSARFAIWSILLVLMMLAGNHAQELPKGFKDAEEFKEDFFVSPYIKYAPYLGDDVRLVRGIVKFSVFDATTTTGPAVFISGEIVEAGTGKVWKFVCVGPFVEALTTLLRKPPTKHTEVLILMRKTDKKSLRDDDFIAVFSADWLRTHFEPEPKKDEKPQP